MNTNANSLMANNHAIAEQITFLSHWYANPGSDHSIYAIKPEVLYTASSYETTA